jgi:hypothetical protein
MTVGDATPAPESPSKKRKVKAVTAKPWATCTKPFIKDWRKDDFLLEFNMTDGEWEILDAQVGPRIPRILIADEKYTGYDYRK